MALIGWLILIAFAAALVVVAALLLLGGTQAWREELAPGFRSRPPRGAEPVLVTLATYGPIAVLIAFVVLFVLRVAVMLLGG
jgi:hypothetical protein